MRHSCLILIIGFVVAAPCRAGFDEGWAAYQRQDYTTAIQEFRAAAAQGDADAQYNLGRMYFHARGVPQNHQEAVKWYRLAAAQGHATAQNNLAAMYAMGLGVLQDRQEAIKWLRLAADQGLAEAQISLGWSYAYGRGVPRSQVAAYALFSVAAGTDKASRAAIARKEFLSNLSSVEVMAATALSRQMNDTGQLLKTLDAFIAKTQP